MIIDFDRHMENQFTNLYDWFSPSHDEKLRVKLEQWFIKQREWANNMIKNNPNDPLWRHASYIFSQLDGLLAGYKSVRGNKKVLNVNTLLGWVNIL